MIKSVAVQVRLFKINLYLKMDHVAADLANNVADSIVKVAQADHFHIHID